jgi:hypothetical protein
MNRRSLQLIELFYWVLGASLSVITVSSIIAFAVGGTLVTVKVGLFVIGVLLFGIGTIGVRPAPAAPHKDKLLSLDGGSQARFEAWIQTLPPLSGSPIRYPDRIRRSWKLLLTSLVVLGVSAFLELGLGIAAGSV